MKDPHSPDADRTALVSSLLRKAHEQSLEAPEPSPFWREGAWRCELHRHAGQDRLKVFRGDRCVHEEIVQGSARAEARCYELRQVLMREGVAATPPPLAQHRPQGAGPAHRRRSGAE